MFDLPELKRVKSFTITILTTFLQEYLKMHILLKYADLLV